MPLAVLLAAPVADAGIVSYWNFDSKAGTTIDDLVAGSSHDGTLTNNADITAGVQGFGGSGEALNSNADGDGGTKGYMLAADSASYNFSSAFTWHAQVKTTGGNGTGILFMSPVAANWNQGSKGLFLEGNRVEWDAGWVGNPNTNVQLTDNA